MECVCVLKLALFRHLRAVQQRQVQSLCIIPDFEIIKIRRAAFCSIHLICSYQTDESVFQGRIMQKKNIFPRIQGVYLFLMIHKA